MIAIVKRLFICVALLASARPAWAHDARPLSIQIAEQQKSTYRVDLRMPPSIDALNQPEISFPEACTIRSGGVRQSADAFVKTMFVVCSALEDGIEGQRIGIRYALFNPSLSTLLRYIPATGGTRTAVLPPDQTAWMVPREPDWKTVAHDYLLLGIWHIWAGVDHLLFVTGLLLLAKTPRRIALAVTGFTLAHSVTLSLSALGVLRLPVPPVEAIIALSILFVAGEVARPDPESLAGATRWQYRRPSGYCMALDSPPRLATRVCLEMRLPRHSFSLMQVSKSASSHSSRSRWRWLPPYSGVREMRGSMLRIFLS